MSEPSRMDFTEVSVIRCDESQALAWDEYLNTSPDASFYQLYGWNRINKTQFGHQVYNLAAFEDGKIVGVFPLVYIKSRIFGKIFCLNAEDFTFLIINQNPKPHKNLKKKRCDPLPFFSAFQIRSYYTIYKLDMRTLLLKK